ncbi:threonine synthase [Albimonas sp. CAU 1670]|uniref:threonine synthase n=1 Tax=Albimonas sp. CAU 1670 TaxID=3032599 RepID=UPI0023DC2B5D|nr:threonine synthase [Albimonas sp. CAU 1670]MDF2231147.1 threonine synthase [Albimonas sp. CAU 1670]
MRYVSTRGQAPILGFDDALLAGLARDGGLYVPETMPQIPTEEIADLAGIGYERTAFTVMRPFVGDALSDGELYGAIERAYASFAHAARAPLVQIGENDWILELHHGPTLAFKDFAMQLIGQLFELVLGKRGQRVTIVGATSGDTGSAAIEAFRGLDAVDVFILYPHGRVSEIQRRQMTTPSEANVHAIAVEGDFDDCQAMVKAMFNDHAFRDEMSLAAVNSINWARVLAQVVYYFTSAVALGAPHRPVSFSVPTGNFGDIFAGHVARRMGLPIDRLVIATNRNDILHRTVATGMHVKEGVTPTISPSMDIQISSNFERLLFELLDRDGQAVINLMESLRQQGGFALPDQALSRLREEFDSGMATEDETRATIAAIREVTGQVIDPHTAVGVKAAADVRGNAATPMVVLGTAHAAKFPDAVGQACGVRPVLPARLAHIELARERVTVLPNDLAALQAHLRREARR